MHVGRVYPSGFVRKRQAPHQTLKVNLKTNFLFMMKSLLNLKKCFAAAVALVFAGSVMAQSITVTGTVKDTSGEALMGVTVIVDGTTTGTATGIDGTYSIRVPNSSAVLRYSYMGYAEQTITVGSQTKIDVVLAEDATAMEDVIVIGYGTIKKSDLTGAVSHVGASDIKERPVSDALQAMQGKVPGVDITSSMRPGELGTVRIRGTRSKNASNDPLYVVDGMPLSAGSMTDLNPNDIESIDILKDASATAIYGSRGANGVILITTKKGETGRVSVNYDGSLALGWSKSVADWATSGELAQRSKYSAYAASQFIGKGARFEQYTKGQYNSPRYHADGNYGYSAPDPYYDYEGWLAYPWMHPVVASAYKYEALTDADGNYYIDMASPVLVPGTDYLGAEVSGGVPVWTPENMYDHDWTKDVTRMGVTMNHQISISGGTEKARIYASAAVLSDEPMQIDQDYRRFTFNMNGEVKANWFTMGMSNNVTYAIRNYGTFDANNVSQDYTNNKDIYGTALSIGRTIPAYYLDYIVEDGYVVGVEESDRLLDLDYKELGEGAPGMNNLLVNKDEGINEYRTWSAMNSTYIEINILPWLKWRTNFGGQYRHNRTGSFMTSNYKNPLGTRVTYYEPSTAYYRKNTSMSWTLENLLYINKTWGKHDFGATLLQSAEESESESIYTRAYNIVFDSAKWYDLASNANGVVSDYGSTYTKTRLASYMARLNYTFDDKYLITLTGRWDGASVLAEGNKWDFFPSVSVAWRIDQENFMKSQDLFSQLKLRFGYGETGNSSVSAYSTTGSLAQVNTVFGSGVQSAVKSEIMPNALLGWEKTGQYNIGLDFGFLNNRISGSIEAYRADTRDLLMNKTLPTLTGYPSVQSNIGKTRNTGVEVALTTRNIEKKDFSWTTTISWGLNRDQVVETLFGKEDDPSQNMYVGESLRTVRGLQYDRTLSTSDEDARLIAIYFAANQIRLMPGKGLFVDQDLLEVTPETQSKLQDQIDKYGTKTIDFEYINNAGETISETLTYVDNGFGIADSNNSSDKTDVKTLGTFSPKWQGGLNNTFTYKNWSLNFYLYARFGNIYRGAGSYLSSLKPNYDDYWRIDNQGDDKYSIIYSSGDTSYSDWNGQRFNIPARTVSVRNIAVSYNFPKSVLNKLKINSGQIYTQILNPFTFSNLNKYGINGDDTKGWDDIYSKGGSNNTMVYQSWVIGLRIGF